MVGLIDSHFHLDMYKNYDEIFQYLSLVKGIFLTCFYFNFL